MNYRFLLFLLVGVGLSCIVVQAKGADSGTHSVYLPLASRAAPMEPVLLLRRDSDTVGENYLRLTPARGEQEWALYPHSMVGGTLSPSGKTALFETTQGVPLAINTNGSHLRQVNVIGFANWSPDDRAVFGQIYANSPSGNDDLYYSPLDGTPRIVATDTLRNNVVWSADGGSLVYGALRNGETHLYQFSLEDNTESLLYASPTEEFLYETLPDGHWLIGNWNAADSTTAITRLDADGSDPVVLFDVNHYPLDITVASDPTGRFILTAFSSGADDTLLQIYTTDGDMVLSTTIACVPPTYGCGVNTVTWRPDGEEVAFTAFTTIAQNPVRYQRRLYAIRSDGSESLPRLLTPDDMLITELYAPEFSPDGRYIAYSALAPNSMGYLRSIVRILEVASGKERVITHGDGTVVPWGWVDLLTIDN